jgi:uncharacterized membrane protein
VEQVTAPVAKPKAAKQESAKARKAREEKEAMELDRKNREEFARQVAENEKKQAERFAKI